MSDRRRVCLNFLIGLSVCLSGCYFGDSIVRLPEFQVQGQILPPVVNGSEIYIAPTSAYYGEPEGFRCLAVPTATNECGIVAVTPDATGRFQTTFPKEFHVVGGTASNPEARSRALLFRIADGDIIYRLRVVGVKARVERTKVVVYSDAFDESYRRYMGLKWHRATEVRVEVVHRDEKEDTMSFTIQLKTARQPATK